MQVLQLQTVLWVGTYFSFLYLKKKMIDTTQKTHIVRIIKIITDILLLD